MIKLGTSNMSKAYVGSSGISKMYLGSELVYQNKLDYIKNGLIFHLDGINTGEDTTKWTDLVADISFPFGTLMTKETNYVAINNSPSIAGSAKLSGYNFSNCTVEFVFNTTKEGTSFVMCLGYVNCPAIIIHKGNGSFAFGTSNTSSHMNAVANCGFKGSSDTFTISANADNIVTNGASDDNATRLHWNFNVTNTNVLLANRTTYASANQNTTCNIYSIRVYDRKLTTEEMINNHKVDNERFNLGLTIE